jgi:hypothetical protein
MPGFDKTGPQAMGSRTGRGLGGCAPTGQTVYGTGVYYGVGRGGFPRGGGRGFAFGGGRGRRFWRQDAIPAQGYYPAQLTREEELAFLQEQAKAMQEELNEINKRVDELTSE